MKKLLVVWVCLSFCIYSFLHSRRPVVQTGLPSQPVQKISIPPATVSRSLRPVAGPKKPALPIARKTASIKQQPIRRFLKVSSHPAAPLPSNNIPTNVPTHANHLNPVTQTKAQAQTQKPYAPEDEELVKRLVASAASHQGSQVAYVGDANELYAIDPNFFAETTNAQGQPSLNLRSVELIINNRRIQREAYPIPPASLPDYDILNMAIEKAIDDGAMLVNVASANVDREQLTQSINYARSHGVPVSFVRPPGMK